MPEFEVNIPDGFSSTKGGNGAVFTYDEEPDVKVLITFNKVPDQLDLHEGGLEFFIDEIKKQIADAEFRNEDKVEVNGLPAIEFEFLHDQQGVQVHKLQEFVKDGDTLYSITCVAPEEKFYGAKPMFEVFTDTFRRPGEFESEEVAESVENEE
jgi:hypothetical protein